MGGVILLGTLLLVLPVSAAAGESVGWSAAFFTATSAVCVTGLIVVDTPTAFSWFGEAVVLLLIQVGGLGYMTVSTLIAVLLGRRVSLGDRLLLQASLNVASRRDLIRFVKTVVKLTLVAETAGAVILTLRWWPEFGLGQASWLGLFHAVSAFNNAGFSLFSTSLVGWRGDAVVNLTVMILIIGGGIGYLTLTEVGRIRAWHSLSLHTRLVLLMTVSLLAGGAIAYYAIERNNAATLGDLPAFEAGLAAVFQSVTTRTAGFNTLDIQALQPAALFLTLIFMFIGGGPGGTSGGVKVTTFGITVLALLATIRGRRDATLFWRRLPLELVARSFLICLTGFLTLNLVAGLLLVVQGGELLPVLFEATSAFGTVGLSTGAAGAPVSLSGEFATPGRLLICVLMFVGRIGPLTLAFALAGRHRASHVRYPEERVLIG
jgi:trk system potassium uptake protein TrkH